MTDLASKKQLYRAIEIAAKDLAKSGGDVTILKSGPFHVMLDFEKGQIKVRVAMDSISEQDVRVVKGACVPTLVCSKKIWCRKQGRWVEKRTIP